MCTNIILVSLYTRNNIVLQFTKACFKKLIDINPCKYTKNVQFIVSKYLLRPWHTVSPRKTFVELN